MTESPKTSRPPGKTLLVVEDDAVLRERLVERLQEAGYQVHKAANGQEGLDSLREGLIPDLIILDMLMPVLDGWQFLRLLQQCAKPSAIPVIVVTGTILTAEWAHSQGCVGLLRKPFKLDTLVREVEQCLGGTAAGALP